VCAGEFIEELAGDNAEAPQPNDLPPQPNPFLQMNHGPPNFANLFTLLQQLMPPLPANNPQHQMYFTNNGNNFVFHANIPPMPNAPGANPFVGYANFRHHALKMIQMLTFRHFRYVIGSFNSF
jgi:hypothetical protein